MMVTVSMLHCQAVELEPQVDKLRSQMINWLQNHTHMKMINVQLWYDGSFKILSTHKVEDPVLKEFLQEFGLRNKGHFEKKESNFHCQYNFIHWDFKEERL